MLPAGATVGLPLRLLPTGGPVMPPPADTVSLRSSCLCSPVTFSLQAQVEQQEAVAAEHLQRQVTWAVNAQLAEHLQHFEEQRLAELVSVAVEQQARRWTQEQLPALLQEQMSIAATAAVEAELQEAVAGLHNTVKTAAEAADHTAADSAAMAADVRQLMSWCCRIAEAHDNHEQRLSRVEKDALVAGAAASTAPVAAAATPACLCLPEQAQREQQLRHDADALEQRLRALVAESSMEQQGRQLMVETSLARLQEQVEQLQAHQVQQASSATEMAHSIITDVTALARHTKALDSELRALRRAVERVQAAVMDTNAAFGKALGIPPPCGIFTSFPPDP